jgi:ketosteroid isomerase-like protein
LIDGSDNIVVPVHVKAKSHAGNEVEVDNVWIYELENGAMRRARLYADTAAIRDAVAGRGSTRFGNGARSGPNSDCSWF